MYIPVNRKYLRSTRVAIHLSTFGFLILTSISCGQSNSERNNNQKITQAQIDACDSPDATVDCCFINIPATLTNVLTIASQQEPGEQLIISGTIFKADGKTPCPNAILYAYHTDSKGYYLKQGRETGAQKWHGRLHGWCKTDQDGHYEIHTIRPARYPDNSIPAHIHAAIKTDNGEMQWINDFVFKDDNLVNKKYKTSYGVTGIVDITKNAKNTWTGKRDITINK